MKYQWESILVERWLAGELSDKETEELVTCLQDPAVRHFIREEWRFDHAIRDSLLVNRARRKPRVAVRPTYWRKLWPIGIAASVMFLVALVVYSNGVHDRRVGIIEDLQEVADVIAKDGARQSVKSGDVVQSGDRFISRGNGRIKLRDGSEISMVSPSSMVIGYDERGVAIFLENGSVSVVAAHQESGRHLRVGTESSEISVIGTKFQVHERNHATKLIVEDGLVEMRRKSDSMEIQVAKNEVVEVAQGIPFRVERIQESSKMLDASCGNDEMRVVVSPRRGGAVTSLLHRGLEFINGYGGRRLLQASLLCSFRGGAVENLVETAPAPGDRWRDPEGRLLEIRQGDVGVTTLARLGNASVLSTGNDLVTKSITLGYGGDVHVAALDYRMELAKRDLVLDHVNVEAPTIYVSSNVESHWCVNVASGDRRLVRAPESPLREQLNLCFQSDTVRPLEIPVLATRDGLHAIAFYSHEDGHLNKYATWIAPSDMVENSCGKLSVIYSYEAPIKDAITVRTFMVVGTLDEVCRSLIRLRSKVDNRQ